MAAMRPAVKSADAARAAGSLRRVSRKPVADSWSTAMTTAETELMVAKIAIRDAASAAADATTWRRLIIFHPTPSIQQSLSCPKKSCSLAQHLGTDIQPLLLLSPSNGCAFSPLSSRSTSWTIWWC